MNELIDYTQKFADKMSQYGEFRRGGNLGKIIQGQLQKEGLEKIAKALETLAVAVKALTPPQQ